MNKQITDSIVYVGANDYDIDLFEGHYVVPEGMAYNSYVIHDEKTAIMDTIDQRKTKEWLVNLKVALQGEKPEYLIIQHMEPDHSANLTRFMEKYPAAVMVATQKAFPLLKQFYGAEYPGRELIVKDGDTLSLGTRTLTFFTAPMVHWPEVMMSYDDGDKVLFSADAFGKFGALDYDDPEGWACEARRYYFGIVGKYGAQVQAVLKKLAGREIRAICALHGPMLTDDIDYYLDTYNTWSSYGVESEGVAICYTSVYGHTKQAAELLAEKLHALGCPKAALSDLARDDMHEAVEDAFRYGKLVLATTTYDAGVFPIMQDFILRLTEHNYQNRRIGIIENGSWAPAAAKSMKALLEGCKNISYPETTVTIRSAPDAETELLQAAQTVREVSGKPVDIRVGKPGYGLNYSGSNKRLKNEIKDLSFTPFKQAVRELFLYYQSNRDRIDKNLLLTDK